MHFRSPCVIALLLALVFPAVAGAQIVNGDFENGGSGWTGGTFPSTGGNPNGYGRSESPASGNNGGDYTIEQTFTCGSVGDNGSCHITLDYKLDFLGGTPGFGVVKIIVDRVTMYTSPAGDHIPWTPVAFDVPCGTHRIALDLSITNNTSNHHWVAAFDNVVATSNCGSTATRGGTWGNVKILYR